MNESCLFSVLSSNEFTGALPSTLSKLINLTDFNFSGKIPDFISKWALIEKLHIQGCTLEGPIPSSISSLTKLTDLRITDLKGSRSSTFPQLSNMKSMKTLMNLRSTWRRKQVLTTKKLPYSPTAKEELTWGILTLILSRQLVNCSTKDLGKIDDPNLLQKNLVDIRGVSLKRIKFTMKFEFMIIFQVKNIHN